MSRPVAVLISDVHYNINTLALADAAMRQAIAKADELDVPLIVAGDLHDTKALLRAECVAALLATFRYADSLEVQSFVLVGNHDLQNEKGEAHALSFLEHITSVVRSPVQVNGLWLLPYYSDADALKARLAGIPKCATLICHQGVMGARMGHYVQDKTSLPPEAFADFRVISGHYHARQEILCSDNDSHSWIGVFSYIGNPYTLTFGEASDPAKGFQVLNTDGSLTFVPTNLRKHVILEATAEQLKYGALSGYDHAEGDLVWVKLTGPKSELDAIDKATIAGLLGIKDFKLDKTATDSTPIAQKQESQTGEELMDALVDGLAETPEEKKHLKDLWRHLL